MCDRVGEGRPFGKGFKAYDSLGDYQKAIMIDYHEKRLKIAQEIVDRAREGGSYGKLGNAYQLLRGYQ